jgi:hypothetical protein
MQEEWLSDVAKDKSSVQTSVTLKILSNNFISHKSDKIFDLVVTHLSEQSGLGWSQHAMPPKAVLASLVCAAVTRLSMFSGPRATDNRILNLLLSPLFFFL